MAGNYSRRNLQFVLYEVFDVLSLTKYDRFSKHDQQAYDMVLVTAEGIAEKYLRPFLKDGDRNPPHLEQGQVKVHKALREYYNEFSKSGLLASTFDEKHGGIQLPSMVFAAADFIIGNAHNGFEMFTSLSKGGAKLIDTFGSKEVKERYLNKILAGEWTATMCLTEAQAGSCCPVSRPRLIPVVTEHSRSRGRKFLFQLATMTSLKTLFTWFSRG